MFTWLISGLLAKAGYTDEVPQGVRKVVVATEYPEAQFKLVDDSTALVEEFRNAALYVYHNMSVEKPIVVVCQQGRSRSVAIACCAAALYRGTSYQDEHDWLRFVDNSVWEVSNIHEVAKVALPYLFWEKK